MMDVDIGLATLSEYDEDGFLQVKVDGLADDSALAAFEAHGLDGFLSRPLDPGKDASGNIDPEQACQVVILNEGDRAHVIPLGDPRTLKKLPTLDKGDKVLYGPTGSIVRMHVDGHITVQTKGGTVVSLLLGVDSVEISHASGSSATVTAEGFQARNATGTQSIDINPTATILDGLVALGGADGGPVVLFELFAQWAAQVEVALATPSPVKAVATPFASIAAAMASKSVTAK